MATIVFGGGERLRVDGPASDVAIALRTAGRDLCPLAASDVGIVQVNPLAVGYVYDEPDTPEPERHRGRA